MPRHTATARPAEPADPEPVSSAQVLRRFRQVFNAVRSHFAQIEKSTGLGGAQLWALSIVKQQPGIGVSELARAMDVHQSTASNLVKALVQRELLMALKDGPDRRAVQLRLQPAAARLLKRAPGPAEGVLPQALRSLDGATLARLDGDLGQLITVLGADARAANIPLSQL
jgi:DNA-binding MarR family transcriptional regulator